MSFEGSFCTIKYVSWNTFKSKNSHFYDICIYNVSDFFFFYISINAIKVMGGEDIFCWVLLYRLVDANDKLSLSTQHHRMSLECVMSIVSTM